MLIQDGLEGSYDSRADIQEQEMAPLIDSIEPTLLRPSRHERATSQRSISGRTLPWLSCWSVGSLAIVVASLILLLNAPPIAVGPVQSNVAVPSDDDGLLDLPADAGYNSGLKGLSKGDRRALMRLKHARQVARHAAEAIERDYGEDASKLLASMHFINRDIIQRKLVRAILLPFVEEDGQRQEVNPFVIAFAGTSVTAGHDNFFNQSYPSVFGRELNRSFSAAGLDLVIRNHAMGNNPAIPACFFVGSQLGMDTDVAAWEFQMMVSGQQGVSSVETWMRNALALPHQPALMMLDPGWGARKPNQDGTPLAQRQDTPSDYSRTYSDQNRDLLRYYGRFSIHAQALGEAIYQLDHKERYEFMTMVKKDKPVGGVDWHPGPHGHELRGRILAYHYLRLLQDALDDVYFAVAEGQFSSLVQLEKYDLPPPMTCKEEFCGHPTKSASTFEPRVEPGLLNYVTEPDKVSRNITVVNADNDQWHVQLFEGDQPAVGGALALGLGYLDRKYALQGTKKAGRLSFKVRSGATGRFILCQPPGVWGKYPDDAGMLDTDAEILIDDQPMLLADKDWIAAHHMRTDLYMCVISNTTYPEGEHKVSISSASDSKYVMLSSIVWPA